MARSSPIARIQRWWRIRRARDRFDPAAAPHRGLVRALLAEHVAELDARARPALIDELTDRLLQLEQSPVGLRELGRSDQLALLVTRMRQALERVVADEAHAARQLANLKHLHASVGGEAEERQLLEDYLAEITKDRTSWQANVKALRRHLDLDAISERNATTRHRLGVCLELGVRFIGRAVAAIDATQSFDSTTAPLIDRADLVNFLCLQLEMASRWHVRWAAAEALGLVVRGDAPGVDLHENAIEATSQSDSERRLTDAKHAAVAGAEAAFRSTEEHAWVRATALEALARLDHNRGHDAIQDAFSPSESAENADIASPPRDFIVRAQAVGTAVRWLDDKRATALLAGLVRRRDPSEHVRLAVAVQLRSVSDPLLLLRKLSGHGVSGDGGEPSPAVRANAAISACHYAVSALDKRSREAVTTVTRQLMTDPSELVVTSACDQLAALAETLVNEDRIKLLHELSSALEQAFGHVATRNDLPASCANAAASAARVLERELDPQRRVLLRRLTDLTARMRPGQRRVCNVNQLGDAAEHARDPLELGRALAQLTRGSWGISARLRGNRLTLWRGDRMRRRLWRIAHEVRNPAPNKRQGMVHTRGRIAVGELRAPPGRLDEATETTVPGERVSIDGEQGWGRHLPLLDDVLDLPLLRPRPIRLVSSHGVTTLRPPAERLRRLRNRLLLSWRYGTLAKLRNDALNAENLEERRRFVAELQRSYGIDVEFTPWSSQGSANGKLAALFPSAGAGSALALSGPIDAARDWLDTNRYYFQSPSENGQTALAIFATGLLGFYIARSFAAQRRMTRARAAIPLSIGGWGTRGKSGTERIKAGLFQGLGYAVFSKTTGCEAMFIHTTGGQRGEEIFLYRAYDKASIWEQGDMLELAAKLGSEVFLWECMALNPRYVSVLEHGWMRDDLCTITNAYPDHEDVQGPAGIDVATTIAQFIPHDSTLITSEQTFLPLFQQICDERKTRMLSVPVREANFIGADMLELFPYQEHPHNIALVARMAEQLGVDPTLAILCMADNVVPDLGVLKSYPSVRVRGRLLTFTNIMSANERTGFIASWRRVGLHNVDADEAPDRQVITVVNNRADRIPRSEVFARILVRDIAADRHVLIGTNLKGLRGYLTTALDALLDERPVVTSADFAGDDRPESRSDTAADELPRLPRERLLGYFARLRIPTPSRAALETRLKLYAAGAHMKLDEGAAAELLDHLSSAFARDDVSKASANIESIRNALGADRALSTLFERALKRRAERSGDAPAEVLDTPGADAVQSHLLDMTARMSVRARIHADLVTVLRGGDSKIADFNQRFRRAYHTLFQSALVMVDNPNTKGDQIVDTAARSVPPGTAVSIAGLQNIKGTGLDFAYRWIAVGAVHRMLGELHLTRADRRVAALEELGAFGDFGFMDAGMARAALARDLPANISPQEEQLRAQLTERLERICAEKHDALVSTESAGRADAALHWLEGSIDYWDAIRRRNTSRRIMNALVQGHISHARAAIEMRALVARQKGGWLAKRLRTMGRRAR